MIAWWGALLIGIAALLVGAVIGYFVTRKIFQTQLEKNPPINEKMIRAMYQQMGRKPSESQVRAIMNSVNKNK